MSKHRTMNEHIFIMLAYEFHQIGGEPKIAHGSCGVRVRGLSIQSSTHTDPIQVGCKRPHMHPQTMASYVCHSKWSNHKVPNYGVYVC